jgi:hypothetical protein
LCGALRYRFDREAVIAAANCHCTDCQHSTGSGMATILLVPTDTLELEGEPRFYTVTGSAGSHVSRGFCPNCGSPVISFVEEDPALRFIKAGSLDDSSWVSVSATYWADSAQPWAPADESTHCFAGNPEF